jgi:HK97 family phage major capsid protein
VLLVTRRSAVERPQPLHACYTRERPLATGVSGRLLGYPFRTSSQIPINVTVGTSTDTSEIYFSSDWNELWIGEERTLSIDASSEASYSSDGTTWNSAYQQRQTVFRAEWMVDLAPRRPQLFTVMTGVRP